MPFQPETQEWAGESAVLLVHGIGNAAVGDYADVAREVKDSLGADAKCAVYELFYDVFNDWFKEKTQFAKQIGMLTKLVRSRQPDGQLAETVAEFAGDVVWPLFSTAARAAVRTAFTAQLRQMMIDGMTSTGKVPGELRFSIICHSLGCLHTYEGLHAMASDPALNLRPFTDGLRFRSVVFMASPVQLIRTLGLSGGGLVPEGLASLSATGLAIPFETAMGRPHKSARRWVSVTGDLDPVGGHFLRKKEDWAYMNVVDADAVAIVDRQNLIAGGDDRGNLLSILRQSLSQHKAPTITAENPHSWIGYVQRHRSDLGQWLLT